MKTQSLLIVTASLAAALSLATPLLAETAKKVMLATVDATVLSTARRARDFEVVGNKLTMHGESPTVLMGSPIL